jgi:hypothetical protein
MESPLQYSNVNLVDPVTVGAPARVDPPRPTAERRLPGTQVVSAPTLAPIKCKTGVKMCLSNANLRGYIAGSPVRIGMKYLDDGTKVRWGCTS